MSRTRKKKSRIPGFIIWIILILITLEFIGLLAVTKLFPGHLLLACSLVLLTGVLIVGLLTRDFHKKIMFSVGTILAVLIMIVLVIGNLYVVKTYNTLTRISGVNTKTSQIGIYVRSDDSAQKLDDTKGYIFGTLSALDQENTNDAVKQINENLGTSVDVKALGGVTELVDSLRGGDCGAIILNHAYLPVLEEMEDYENISEEIREIELLAVDTVIEDKKDSADSTLEQQNPDSIIRLYISGIDTRGNEIINTRSDVNIIATINTDTKQVLLVSTPRDYFVPLSISDGIPDKLTHAGIYGVDVSMDTLGMLYGIPLDKYFRVNFAGFIKIIDALGGVDIYSDYDFTGNWGYSFTKGINHVDGEAALAFARERYAFSEGDRQRGKNQMEVIRAVLQKIMSPELLSRYTDVLSAVEGCFETNFSYDRIARLVRDQLADGRSWNIVSYSVDGTGDTQQPYSMSMNVYVMIPNQATVDKAKMLMQQVVDGKEINLNE